MTREQRDQLKRNILSQHPAHLAHELCGLVGGST
jgi:hypothetical protein